MSHVTDIIITCSLCEPEVDGERPKSVEAINKLISEAVGLEIATAPNGVWLKEVSDHAGGNKAFQGLVYLAAVNYMDIDYFKEGLDHIEWREPGYVMVLIKDENEDQYSIYLPIGRLHEQL